MYFVFNLENTRKKVFFLQIDELFDYTLKLKIIKAQFCSVVVITFASHAKGPRFEPGQN